MSDPIHRAPGDGIGSHGAPRAHMAPPAWATEPTGTSPRLTLARLLFDEMPHELTLGFRAALLRSLATPSIARAVARSDLPFPTLLDELSVAVRTLIAAGAESDSGRAGLEVLRRRLSTCRFRTDDARYLLALLATVPADLADQLRHHRLTPHERAEHARYFSHLGALLEIAGVPSDPEDLQDIIDRHELTRTGPSRRGRALARVLMAWSPEGSRRPPMLDKALLESVQPVNIRRALGRHAYVTSRWLVALHRAVADPRQGTVLHGSRDTRP